MLGFWIQSSLHGASGIACAILFGGISVSVCISAGIGHLVPFFSPSFRLWAASQTLSLNGHFSVDLLASLSLSLISSDHQSCFIELVIPCQHLQSPFTSTHALRKWVHPVIFEGSFRVRAAPGLAIGLGCSTKEWPFLWCLKLLLRIWASEFISLQIKHSSSVDLRFLLSLMVPGLG